MSYVDGIGYDTMSFRLRVDWTGGDRCRRFAVTI
jgi:hypothetical protein